MAVEVINEETGEIRCAPCARCWVVRTNQGALVRDIAFPDDIALAETEVEMRAEPERWGGRHYP